MPFDQGHALVIGVGTYANVPQMNVEQTANDAARIAALLPDPALCGYPPGQVHSLIAEEATRANIVAALKKLAKSTTPDSTVFVFYAGHGEFGADGSYYLTTHDTRIDGANRVVADTGITEKELLKLIKRIPARRALLIFNACYSGEISPGLLGAEDAPEATGKALPDELTTALLGTGEGRVIITACRDGQKSYFVRAAQRTIFADALAAALEGKDIPPRRGTISVFDLYESIYTTVSTAVKEKWSLAQEPELTISNGVGVMAVALHGAGRTAVLGIEDEPEAPGPIGAVRTIDTQKSAAALEKILGDDITAENEDTPAVNQDANIDQLERVRRICAALPETTERLSHGEPTFFVRNKVYVMFANNHHNDGHIAVWIPTPPGFQAGLIESAPKIYFRPPYVGHRGWVGIELAEIGDPDLAFHIRTAWELTAPKRLVAKVKAMG